MATVFTFDPAFFPLISPSLKPWLGGELYESPNQRVHVPYVNSPIKFDLLGWDGLKNVENGAAKIDRLWPRYPRPYIFLGHSMGGQLLNYWLRNYGPSSSLDPDDALFVVTGDMEQPYNGAGNFPGSGYTPGYGGSGIPDDSPYPYVCANRQYDRVGDFPNDTGNAAAIKNIKQGHSIHMDYSMCSLSDPNNRTYSPPGRAHHKYVLFPTPLLPTLSSLAWHKSLAAKRDAEQRPAIEAAYDRPMEAVDPPHYAQKPKKNRVSFSWVAGRKPPMHPIREI